MPKKLIEVSLPLEAINRESAREKSIRHGHPSTLHLWWARRPLASCRAVLWSSLVDDPSEYMPDEESANRECERLFAILEDLVKWENSTNEEILDKARLEVARSVARNLGVPMPVGKQAIREFLATQAPPVLDPFAGGGSIPLEAQRLGLRAYASDLNPVAVLINKALIEIPPQFAGLPPVHPSEPGNRQETLLRKEWKGAEGLAEDVRFYGKWMRDEAEKRIGHLYPKARITAELLAERDDLRQQGFKPGDELTVIAWLWARTVKCPNPACGARMPLAASFVLSSKKGKQAWVEPIIDPTRKRVNFTVRAGKGVPPPPPKLGRGAQFRCLVCGQTAPEDIIRAEFKAKHNGEQLMAIVAEGKNGRAYLPPEEEHVRIAQSAKPDWIPEEEMNTKTPNLVSGRGYGITHWHELFTPRQLTALTTFSDLVKEARERVLADARLAGDRDPQAYADAAATYLGMAVSRLSNRMSSLSFWDTGGEKTQQVFARQALPMTWDFVEANPLCNSTGSYINGFEYICSNLQQLIANVKAIAIQNDATKLLPNVSNPIVSTDPPYYDNIGYADLSDFFYIWLRYSLKDIYRDLFSTVLVSKSDELVATPYRFNGDAKKAFAFFESGLRKSLSNIERSCNKNYPVTIFYAYKQSEQNDDGVSSTGWETFITGVLEAGFQIHGTWPMRTEQPGGLRAIGQNSLASSIVLVCRPRPENAPAITRREFLTALKRELPSALRELQKGNIAPVDLAQAAIGPGMAIFSRHKAVLEADGSPMRVRTALALINQALDEYLSEQEGDYDGDTRWALAWFEQFGFNEGPYGIAETLSKAKNTSVEGLEDAGLVQARGGKVRLLRREELANGNGWDPQKDKRPTVWEACQHLIHALEQGGEGGAGKLLSVLGSFADPARDLAYRLYAICERKGWAQEALAYNMLATTWSRIKEQASKSARQESLL